MLFRSKVTVGNCLTMEEAIILWGKIRDAFDRAFIVPESMPLELFGQQPVARTDGSEARPDTPSGSGL